MELLRMQLLWQLLINVMIDGTTIVMSMERTWNFNAFASRFQNTFFDLHLCRRVLRCLTQNLSGWQILGFIQLWLLFLKFEVLRELYFKSDYEWPCHKTEESSWRFSDKSRRKHERWTRNGRKNKTVFLSFKKCLVRRRYSQWTRKRRRWFFSESSGFSSSRCAFSNGSRASQSWKASYDWRSCTRHKECSRWMLDKIQAHYQK